MLALPRWIVLLSGWPRRLVAFAAGAVGAVAMAPLDLFPALVVPMTVAVWLIDGSARDEGAGRLGRSLRWQSCRAAAGAGWWWGFGYFIAGFWWLGAAFLVEPEKDAWALPFGVLGVPAILALFPALGFAVARLLWSSGSARILALMAGLGIAEWLRGWVLTGFPWNNFGMALGGNLVLAQSASLIGNSGLTLLAIGICAAPATLADSPPRVRRLGRFAPTLLAVTAVAAMFAFGWNRLSGGPVAAVSGVRLRIMQPNLPQDAKFSFANKDQILADYLDLSSRTGSPDDAGLKTITHLIWPESAFPFILSRDPEALESIAKSLPQNVTLITGAARLESGADGGGAAPTYFNAIQVVGPGGVILDSYDKVHLVPFGEYLPFDHVLRRLGLSHFVHIPGGFSAGRRRRLLDVPGLPPVAPVICYEAIFSGEVLPTAARAERSRASVLLNVTNDGWFGHTSGPYQHLAQARLRAIEEGLPLIRAANTGVSAIVDPFGRLVSSLPLGTTGVLDGDLPERIPPPFFTLYQAFTSPLLQLLTVLAAFLLSRIRGTK